MTPRSASAQPVAALLRAVNLAGRNMVPMPALRDLATALGFRDARTLLQSGNLVFSDPEARSTAELEQILERAVAKELGVTTLVFARGPADLAAIVARNPFPRAAQRDPGHLTVTFLRAAPAAGQVKALQATITGREQVRAVDREVFTVYPDGIGRSKLTGAVFDRHIGIPGTARNWNTVLKLQALLAGS